jgi:proteasome lid subunit RPN8/RPN11
MTNNKAKPATKAAVVIDADVLRQMRQQARASMKTEICGVLIGSEENGVTMVEACIEGENAAQGGSHVTFTQDTWEHIYKIKDSKYPDDRIVGWYHSHPGFGVFLSDHDTFIHENFFSAPHQVAWVVDPQTDEEGCFGWVDGRIRRLSNVQISDRQGGKEPDRRAEPNVISVNVDDEEKPLKIESEGRETLLPNWARWTIMSVSYVAVLLLGGFLGSEFMKVNVERQLPRICTEFVLDMMRVQQQQQPGQEPSPFGQHDVNPGLKQPQGQPPQQPNAPAGQRK